MTELLVLAEMLAGADHRFARSGGVGQMIAASHEVAR